MELLHLFITSIIISISTFGGGAQALYYQYAVSQQQWINAVDLSSILSFGYATPGPAVFGVSTFIGYKLGGIIGAIVGTIGIFIIPFLGGILANKHLSALLKNKRAQYVVKGVSLATVGIIVASALSLFFKTNESFWQIITAVTVFVACLKYKINPLTLVICGIILGVTVG